MSLVSGYYSTVLPQTDIYSTPVTPSQVQITSEQPPLLWTLPKNTVSSKNVFF